MKTYEVKFGIGDKVKVIDAEILGVVVMFTIHSENHIVYSVDSFDGDTMKSWSFLEWQLEEFKEDSKLGFEHEK